MSILKTNYVVKSKYEAFYTGGRVQMSSDGVYLFCGCGNKVNVLEMATGSVFTSIGNEEDDEISSFCLSPDDKYLIIATQQLLLRQWDWREKKLVRSWKAIHFAPVVTMAFDCTSTLLATGSADSTIKLWDIEKQYCTHNLKGHQGLISAIVFHTDISKLQLYSAGEDYKVRVWNLAKSTCIAEVAAHYSVVTSIVFSPDGHQAVISSRDGVVSIWDTRVLKVTKTIPVFEVVESVVIVPGNERYSNIGVEEDCLHFITAGNKGLLRVWNAKTSKCVFSSEEVHAKHAGTTSIETPRSAEDTQNIIQMQYNKEQNAVVVVTYDHNISLIGLEKLRLKKQFAGNNDEIVDVRYFGEEEKYAVVATNSMYIKVFELANWDCEILYGHTDIVLAIDVVKKGDMFISSAKDNTVRLWKLNPAKKEVFCLAVGQGHTHAVGAVAFSRLKAHFFVSGSEDCTLKLWNIPTDLDTTMCRDIHAAVTQKAHDKNISSTVVSPNDRFIATGSMDKTAKLWDASTLKLLGVMRGHKRGIWCVEFSPIDQVLATSSGDGTVKLWSLSDFSCVKTFEGHDCAVLKVTFINRGMQLLSSGTSGLVKLWTIKTNECVKTLDEHEDKVWALTADDSGDTFLTGGADSTLIIWQDVTQSELDESRQKQELFILQEQELSNLIKQKKYLKAIGLAITLDQPFRVLNIIKEILSEAESDVKLHETLNKMRPDQIDALLRFTSTWNTNSRHCHEAQCVLASVLQNNTPSQLKKLGNLKSSVEGLIPYTDRHLSRMSRLLQQSMFLEYTWQCMKNVATDSIHTEEELNTEDVSADIGKMLDTLENKDDESSSESEAEDISKSVKKDSEESSESSDEEVEMVIDKEKELESEESSEESSDNENSGEQFTEVTVDQDSDEDTEEEDSDEEEEEEGSEEDLVGKKRSQHMKTPKMNLYQEFVTLKQDKQLQQKNQSSVKKRKDTDQLSTEGKKFKRTEEFCIDHNPVKLDPKTIGKPTNSKTKQMALKKNKLRKTKQIRNR